MTHPTKFYTNAPWGKPFDYTNMSREPEIREYMETKVNTGGGSVNQSALVVRTYLGDV